MIGFYFILFSCIALLGYFYYIAVYFLKNVSDEKASLKLRRVSLAGGVLTIFVISLFQMITIPMVKDAGALLSDEMVVERGFVDTSSVRIPFDGLTIFERVDMNNRRHMKLPFTKPLLDKGYYEITYLPNTNIIIEVKLLQNDVS